MNRFSAVICIGALAACGALAVSGCKNDSSSSEEPRVGVVDMDKVAGDLNWMSDMDNNLKALQKRFGDELSQAKDQYAAQIQAKKLEFAPKESDKLTNEQQQILQGMTQYANGLLGKLQQDANQEFNTYRQQSIMQYRAAIRPIVQQVAEDKKLWFVSERNESVLFYDPDADITNAVIDQARARPPLLTAVPVPQLPNPGTITVNLTTQPSTQPTTRPAATQP